MTCLLRWILFLALKNYLFLTGEQLLYSIVCVSARYLHESEIWRSLFELPPTPSSCLSVYFWFIHCSVCRLHLNNQGRKKDMLGRILSQLFKIQNVSSRMMVKWLESIDFCFLSWRLWECESKQTLWKPVESLWKACSPKPSSWTFLDSSTLTLSHAPLRPTCSQALVLGTLSPLGLSVQEPGNSSATPSLWTSSYFMYPPSVSFLSSSFFKIEV